MSILYTPRAYRPVYAVRLKEDLIVPKGDWVTIDEEGEVRQFTDAQFTATYAAPVRTAKGASVPRPRTKSENDQPKPTGYANGVKAPNRTLDGIMRTGGGRILYVVKLLGGSATTKQAEALLGEPAGSRLSELKYFGLITGGQVGGRGNVPSIWSITDAGHVALNRFGTEMFTKFNKPVPVLQSSPASPNGYDAMKGATV